MVMFSFDRVAICVFAIFSEEKNQHQLRGSIERSKMNFVNNPTDKSVLLILLNFLLFYNFPDAIEIVTDHLLWENSLHY